jgi:hypothetical protein
MTDGLKIHHDYAAVLAFVSHIRYRDQDRRLPC